MNAPSRPEEFWRSRLKLPVYHVADAARYADVSGGTVRNWHRPSNRPAALSRKEPRESLSYLQLIELAIVAAARKTGVSLAAIRRARNYCGKEFNSKFPFAEYRFKTDGKELWLDLVDIDGRIGRGKLVSTSQYGQLGWAEIIGRLREFDYDRTFGVATRWHVAGRRAPIVIDPRLSFGAPTVAGIPTQLLKMRWEAGEPAESLSDDYDIPEAHIVQALKFEGVDYAAAGAWRKN